MTARKLFFALFLFAAGAGAVFAQGEMAKPVARDVVFYQDHGIARQFGASLAELTAPDIARKIKVGWKYNLADFPKDQAGKLLKHMHDDRVAIAVDLADGNYAVMTSAVAKRLGFLPFNDADSLTAYMNSNPMLTIISPDSNYFDLKSVGKISHWGDPIFEADVFAAKYSKKIMSRSGGVPSSQ